MAHSFSRTCETKRAGRAEKERRMQIRALSSPWELPARALSTSTACQSALPCCPTSPPPSNAPLGAGLCIFNKFRESSASRRSRPPVAALKAAFRLPRKRCPRVYLCATREFAILLGPPEAAPASPSLSDGSLALLALPSLPLPPLALTPACAGVSCSLSRPSS